MTHGQTWSRPAVRLAIAVALLTLLLMQLDWVRQSHAAAQAQSTSGQSAAVFHSLPASSPPDNAQWPVSHDPSPQAEVGGTTASAREAGGALPPPVFRFAAGGDHHSLPETAATLTALGQSGAAFFLALGDMSYDALAPESSWCEFVIEHVGADFPFELLVGNHEDQPGDDGFIDEFAACLPDRLGVRGLYGHRYFFDYPPEQPLARFILIDPDLYRGQRLSHYCKDGETINCNWLAARIAEAEARGYWTIVGSHKNCITMGEKPCEIGSELLNQLVGAGVDLILQGHEHLYQRSRQLARSQLCPSIPINSFDPACVSDDGLDGRYRRGAGSVIVIAGTMGVPLRSVSEQDPESPYFVTWMDKNRQSSNGFVAVDVSPCALQVEFVPTVGSYRDLFAIVDDASTHPFCQPAPPRLPHVETVLTSGSSGRLTFTQPVTISVLFPAAAVSQPMTVSLTLLDAATVAPQAINIEEQLWQPTELSFGVKALAQDGGLLSPLSGAYSFSVHIGDFQPAEADAPVALLGRDHGDQAWNLAAETATDSQMLAGDTDRPAEFLVVTAVEATPTPPAPQSVYLPLVTR